VGAEGEVVSTLSLEKEREYKTLVWATPRSRIFHDRAEVTFENLVPGTELRFTTDGSEPDANSALYTEPIPIAGTTTFTVRAFGPDGARYRPWTGTYTATELKPAADVKAATSGLTYALYTWEGTQTSLPDFQNLEPVATGTVRPDQLSGGIDVAGIAAPRKDGFGLVLSGYLNVDRDQVYNFRILSDDGARLIIDGETVVDLNTHSGVDPWESEVSMGLKAGLHPVRILYYQDARRTRLQISAKPGDAHQRTPISPRNWRTE
jgi:hexosaminidase